MRSGARLLTAAAFLRLALPLAGALAVAIWAPAARAAEKMAVLILSAGSKDAELADNVTEMVIAAVARRGGVEVAGKEEFRARLGDMTESRAQLCLEEIACVGRTAVSLGVRRIVTGTVGTRGPQFLFSLNLHDVEVGRVENRVFRLIEGSVNDLIKAVEAGSEELFRPKVEPGRIQVASLPANARVSIDNAYLGVTPLLSGTLIPGSHRVRVEADGRFPWISTVEVRSGKELGINLSEANLPRRRRWPAYAAYGAGGFALAAGAAGGLLGVLSQVNPAGDTRAAAQRDLAQKDKMATQATAAFITAGAAAAISAALFIIYRDDIFGRGEQ